MVTRGQRREQMLITDNYNSLQLKVTGPNCSVGSYSTLPKLLARKIYALETHEGRNEMCG